MAVQVRGGAAAARRGGGASPGRRGKRGFRLRLPVIPPDTILSLRFFGLALAVAGGYTLVALVSPDGTLTHRWAAGARALAGWAAEPWSVLAFAAALALMRGRRALRRAVAGRLAGVTLLLLAATSVNQILYGTVVEPGALSSTPPGVDGYVGLYAGAGLALLFGPLGAIVLMAVVSVAGFGLVCGWSLATWTMLGQRLGDALRLAGRLVQSLARAAWQTLRYAGRLGPLLARGVRAAATWLGHRYERWKIARALRAEQRAAARRAAEALAAAQALAATVAAEDPPAVVERAAPPDDGVTLHTVRQVDPPALPGTLDDGTRRSPIQWQLPSTSMLSAITAEQIGEAEITEKKRVIERTLAAFNVPVTVKEALVGPTVTQFSLIPAEGISVKKIKMYEADLQLVLAAQTLRIELPIPGRPVVGLEIPNSGIATVGMREILESPQFRESKGRLRLALGRDVDGKPRVGDLARMPHLLIAGQTGSGKSVCVNTIIASLLYQCTPDELQLLMIDPKMVEMAEYEGIPHLKYPVVVDLAEAGKVLLWAVEEMERRYRLLSEVGFRHIDLYNKSIATLPRMAGASDAAKKPLPYMVIIIDELADLMMFAPDDVEPAICRLTAKARAVGIHLVVATQRPSVDVVTGLIKANMPSRIAFAVSSQIDSRVILDMGGAESLLGRGDMLYLPFDQGKPLRVQGTWVSDDEISKLIDFWKRQGSPQYVQKSEIEALMLKQESADAEKAGDKHSPLVERAVALLQTTSYVSVSYLQRKLGIGYPRAARLLDELEERGLVEADEAGGRSYRVVQDALDDPATEPALAEIDG